MALSRLDLQMPRCDGDAHRWRARGRYGNGGDVLTNRGRECRRRDRFARGLAAGACEREEDYTHYEKWVASTHAVLSYPLQSRPLLLDGNQRKQRESGLGGTDLRQRLNESPDAGVLAGQERFVWHKRLLAAAP